MALTATFDADFTKFKGALSAAAQQLRDFDNSTGKVTGSVKAEISGLGSAFKALGPLIPVASFAAATHALIGLGRSAIESASQITDLGNKTGLSLDTIQRMQHVAAQTGTSLEVFTQASFKMGAILAEGGKKAQEAIRSLGLSFEDIRRMSPDKQFATIVQALENVHNQQERNRLGVALFGRGFSEMAAAVGEGYTRLASEAAVAEDAQIRALDNAGDAWRKFKDRASKEIQAFLGTAVTAMSDLERGADKLAFTEKVWILLTRGASDYAEQLREVGRQQAKIAGARTTDIELPSSAPVAATTDYTEALRAAQKEVAELSRLQRTQLNAALKLGGSAAKDYAASIELSDAALRLYESSLRATSSSVKQAGKDTEKAAKEAQKLSDAIRELGRDASGTFGMDIMIASGALGKFTDELSEAEEIAGRLVSGNAFRELFVPLKDAVQQMPPVSAWEHAWGGMKDGLSAVLSDIPSTLVRAFEGGGDILGAVKSIAARMGATIGGGIGEYFGGPLGRQLGEAFGSLLGPLTGKIAEAFGAIPAAVKRAREELTRFQETIRDTLSDDIRRTTQGWEQDVIAVRDAMINLGRTEAEALRLVEAMWDTDNPKRSKAAIEEINRVLRESAKRTQEVADAQRELTRLQQDAKYTFQEMQQDADTLGINFERMGQIFQQAKIDETSNKYVNAIDRLITVTGDPGHVLFESREAMSKLVQEALKFGTVLPQNMEEWIKELHRAGLLVDENGEAIDDLSRIKFGERIATEAEIIQTAMENLERIINRIADALENFPSLPNFNAGDYSRPPAYAGPQARGGDYMVTKPTLFMAGEAGAERATFTPVGMQGRTETIVVQNILDGRVISESVIEHVGSRLALRGAR